ncbi:MULTISPECIES: pentapeptide repeat-containing protein [unclassified Microcystis]|uniref:pentapeptide repeat-containing protein n=1 Tax=unclassified Microcystis TaxID=2643300 RepID=UPI00118F5691|nr:MULTISPECIES: pentapeptide repeat-containing protein [unclassified Microcystis]MCA2924774.1 pentapeptide repeat-containing protein [Microcystis sp. M020S1]MCA2937382.1 pentapeptide repeat-containing protein [Microcystis sp. M015S1]MCA2621274.1 pentapeptide repeat-containing protein [Microcystis sp. M099S2]MCA2648554.1 pentapeptide repeat-containing protein [Microcystis sp. M065S2]MCA2678250.1 pentapeptide repeat-containing protein [Microcystis sp. M043S2]
MITSDVASLIIGIEENVQPESAYYGKPVEWREKYQTWHYGIGLSDTHFFSLGTLEKQELQLLKRHDIRDFDLRILPDVKSPFESDEVIERLKYALRWLDDLPENSSQKTITGKGLAFQILTGNPDYEYSRDTKPIPPDLSYEDYLKQSCPKLKPSKYFLKNPQVWAYMFLFIFVLFAAILTPPLFDLIKNLIGSIAWLESIDNLVENISKILFFLLIFIISFLLWRVFVIISNFKWSGFQKKSFWDWLQLLIIPLMLALGAFYLNSAADFRDYQIAQEQKHQEILTDYFSKMQDLIVETKKSKQTPGSKESNSEERLLTEFRPTAQALTLSVLEQLDGERKGKVIIYLAESQLITVDNNKPYPQPEIKLDGTNLDDIKLGNNGQRNSLNEKEMTIIDKIKIRNANMKRANLSGFQLLDSELNGSNLENATLENVNFTGSTMIGSRFINGKITDVNFTDVTLGKTIFDNVNLKNITISNKTNFDNACFTKIDTSNTKQGPYLLTKEHLKKLIDKKNVLEAKTYQECIQKIKNAIQQQNSTNLTGAE